MPSYPLGLVMHHLRRWAGAQEVRDQSDEALVERFAESRDEAGFEALLRRHGPMVLAVCRRVLGNHADAEDAFQATFVILARKAGAIRKRSSVGSWLHGIALRVSLGARRARTRRQAREQETPIRTTDSGRADLHDLAAVLDDQLERLPAKYRDPLVLCYLEGMTRAEGAKQLGWCLRTFMRRIERGKELLRRRLMRQGYTLSATLCASALGEHFTAAPLPAALVAAAVRHALLALAGTAATAAVPVQVTALADGLAGAMAAKLRVTLVLVQVTLSGVAAAFGVSRRDDPASPLPVAADGRKEQTQRFAPVKPVRKGFRHGGPVSSVVFAANGKTIIAADDGSNASIRSWDAATGQELYAIHVDTPVFALAVSRTGNLLAVAGEDRLIRLWDATTGKALGILCGHNNAVYSLVFAHDGKRLFSGDVAATVRWSRPGEVIAESLAGFAGTVRVWDTLQRELIGTLSLPWHNVHSLVLSPDGKTLAVACQAINQPIHPICVWDAATLQQRVHIADGHIGAVLALAFSNDGKTLASAGSDGRVQLWNAASGQLVRKLSWGETSASPVQALAFSPLDGTLIGGCRNARLCAWDPDTGRLLWSREAHPSNNRGRKYAEIESFHGTTALAFSPDGTSLVSGGSDERLRVWDSAGKERRFNGAR
jgi:RNA polymerase sigma factor (sigma-70 family)